MTSRIKHGPSVHDPECDSWERATKRGREMHFDPRCEFCRKIMVASFGRHPDGVGGWTKGGAA